MKKRLGLSILLLVLVAGGIFAFVYFYKKPVVVQPAERVTEGSLNINYAAPGKLVDSMPTNLILDKSAKTYKSYDFLSDNNKQSTAIVYSKESTKTVDEQYKKYLTANNYKIVNEISGKNGAYALYASGATNDVSLSINAQKMGTQIT